MDKICYLGDMLNIDGDADAAVAARVQTGLTNWHLCTTKMGSDWVNVSLVSAHLGYPG